MSVGRRFDRSLLKVAKRGYHVVRQGLDRLWFAGPSGRAHRRKLMELRGAHAGRRCFVICNGPSLSKTDIRLLENEVSIGSNAIFLLFARMDFRPTYLTVEDRLVAEDRAKQLNAIKDVEKIFPRDLARVLRADHRTTYIHFVRVYRPFPQFSADLRHVAYWGGTVTFLNLQLAYHLGCNPIYLIGCDHNYVVPANLTSPVITSQGDDVNHFDPSYFGKGYRWHDPNVGRMERSYRVARLFLEARGVSVYNATAGGQLEVFERVDYEEVVCSGWDGSGSRE